MQIKQFICKHIFILAIVFSIAFCCFGSDNVKISRLSYTNINNQSVFCPATTQNNVDKLVYLGGETLGFEYTTRGVLVVAKNKLMAKDDFIDINQQNNILPGDVILAINGEEVNNACQINEILNQYNAGDAVTIDAIRKGKQYETRLKPVYDLLTKKYKLGLWVKNTINGIGTLTYIDPSSDRFGSLGHSVVDTNTGVLLPVLRGSMYDCTVIGVKRAIRGSAGEIKAVLKTNTKLGDIDDNNSTGIYGTIGSDFDISNKTIIPLGGKKTITPGKALMYTSIDGKNVRAYDIEIIKTNNKDKDHRDMVIKITDERLIKATGGILQGMSGSPIVQNGRLVGAVTHVFINDATKGFGIFIDNMIKN